MVDKFFYPHFLQKKVNGTWVNQFECGEQPNSGGKAVNTVERVDYIFKSLIFYPKEISDYVFLAGEEIRVVDDSDVVRITGKVARFDVGRLDDNRIWI